MSDKLKEALIKCDDSRFIPRSGYVIQPRVAALRATLGSIGEEAQPQRGCVSTTPRNRHNPAGVGCRKTFVPRVVAQRDNPGLRYLTALRYKSKS